MGTVKIILIVATLFTNISCNAQTGTKVTDKTFQTFLDKFKTVNPPINHKKINLLCVDMTQKEAISFLQKKESDLLTIRTVLGEDENGNEVIDYEMEENIPCCNFSYQLNDSILILCTREGGGSGEKDTTLVCLNSFTLQGKLIDRCIVGGSIYYYESPVFENHSDFILIDKNTVRVFYYDEDYISKKEGFNSTIYYINYKINPGGKFIKNEKSEIYFLKQHADFYFQYSPKNEDDPMNEYDL